MDHSIEMIKARQVFDSKARPALEVDVWTQGGSLGRALAPTGTSVGTHEAFILRDNDPKKYFGMSVYNAIDIVEKQIAPKLLGRDVRNQEEIDNVMLKLDGTADKHILGGNTIYSISAACLRAAAASEGMFVHRYLAKRPLDRVPIVTFNVVNGGKNKNGIIQGFNEFIIVPHGTETLNESIEIAVEVYKKIGQVIENYQKGKSPILGGSFGWAAPDSDPEIVMELIGQAVALCGYEKNIDYSIDCASSEMYDAQTDTYELCNQRVSAQEMIDKARVISEKYPVLFVEDLLFEDDWSGFREAHKQLLRTNLIGDDFIVSNIERLKRANEKSCIDGFIFKPNQIGTITEALAAVKYAKENGMLFIPSCRAGGPVNDIVVELAIGLRAVLVKNGAPQSGERLENLNTYIRAADELGFLPMADISSLRKSL